MAASVPGTSKSAQTLMPFSAAVRRRSDPDRVAAIYPAPISAGSACHGSPGAGKTRAKPHQSSTSGTISARPIDLPVSTACLCRGSH